MAIEVAYVGTYSDNVDLTIRQDILPVQYWNHTDTRNAALATSNNQNVPNPFFIGNLTALRTSNPALYNQLAAQALFTSPTIQKNRLLRPFPHMSVGNNALQAQALPLGKVRTHAIEVAFQRRFSQGLSLNAAYSGIRAEEWLNVINEYDAAPTQWITSQNARPHRVTLNGVYELPFGRGRRFLSDGGLLGHDSGRMADRPDVRMAAWSAAAVRQRVLLRRRRRHCDRRSHPRRVVQRRRGLRAQCDSHTGRLPGDGCFRCASTGFAAHSTLLLNSSISRSFPLMGRSTLQIRLDAANMLNRQHFANSAAQSHGDRFRPCDGQREHRAALPDPDVEADVLSGEW